MIDCNIHVSAMEDLDKEIHLRVAAEQDAQKWKALAQEIAGSIDDLMWYISTRNVSGNDVWSYFWPLLLRDDVHALINGRKHSTSQKDEIELRFKR